MSTNTEVTEETADPGTAQELQQMRDTIAQLERRVAALDRRPRSRSPSPDAPPGETRDDRWLRKQLEKEDAKQELDAVQHRGRRQREMARDELEEMARQRETARGD